MITPFSAELDIMNVMWGGLGTASPRSEKVRFYNPSLTSTNTKGMNDTITREKVRAIKLGMVMKIFLFSVSYTIVL